MVRVDGGGSSDDRGKSRMDQLPWESIYEIGFVAEFGIRKHPNTGKGPAGMNFRRGMAYSKHLGAALRHMSKWLMGETLDPESKRHHLAHVCWRFMVLLSYELQGYGKMADGVFQDVRIPSVETDNG